MVHTNLYSTVWHLMKDKHVFSVVILLFSFLQCSYVCYFCFRSFRCLHTEKTSFWYEKYVLQENILLCQLLQYEEYHRWLFSLALSLHDTHFVYNGWLLTAFSLSRETIFTPRAFLIDGLVKKAISSSLLYSHETANKTSNRYEADHQYILASHGRDAIVQSNCTSIAFFKFMCALSTLADRLMLYIDEEDETDDNWAEWCCTKIRVLWMCASGALSSRHDVKHTQYR